MATDKPDNTDSSSDWTVTNVEPDTVEITRPQDKDTKYILHASKRVLRVEAYEAGKLVEQNQVVRGVHEFIMEAFDEPDTRVRLAISPSKESITTHVLLNDEEFEVESAPGEHPLLLHQQLMKRHRPTNRRIQVLADELNRGSVLREEVQRQTKFGDQVVASDIPNGVIAACVAICFLCALGSFPACVGCAICIEIPHPTVVKA